MVFNTYYYRLVIIGLLLGSLLEVIGLIGNSKYVNAFTVASLMSLVIGGYRGIRHLLRLDEHKIEQSVQAPHS